jgi:putative transposase
MDKIYYRRNLLHIIPNNAQFFVTFTLDGALPGHVIKRLLDEKEERIRRAELTGESKYFIEKIYFAKYDNLLANPNNKIKWLEKDELAKIVADKLNEFDGNKYELICYCIMPNHVHLLIDTMNYTPETIDNKGTTNEYYLTDVLRLIKGSTSRKCNIFLEKNGKFWQAESYDHFVRDRNELQRIISYILQNPVKANLCNNWYDWKWTFIKDKYNEFCVARD